MSRGAGKCNHRKPKRPHFVLAQEGINAGEIVHRSSIMTPVLPLVQASVHCANDCLKQRAAHDRLRGSP